MIVVLADDLTGAAELAGIGLGFGKKVQLCLNNVTATDADVLIVSSDSRSMLKEGALNTTAALLKEIQALQPEWVYKKIDSVLRGYVVDELKIQLQLSGKPAAIIVPANPSLGRKIMGGKYYVNDVPVNETAFQYDPEFPITSADVAAILNHEVSVINAGQLSALSGIAVAETTTINDVKAFAAAVNDDTVLCGGGDFFTALLQRHEAPRPHLVPTWQQPLLMVSGTTFHSSVQFIREMHQQKGNVVYLSENILNSVVLPVECINDVQQKIRQHTSLIITFDPQLPQGLSAVTLRNRMATVVQTLLQQCDLPEIIIEGGASAAAILDALQITTLQPVNEVQRGVVRMKAGNTFFTLKPGSYVLPQTLKEQFY